MDDMQRQLRAEKDRFNFELATIEAELRKLRGRGDELRKKVAAIDTLLGPSDADLADNEPDEAVPEQDVDDEVFTPVRAYWRPILQVLIDMGGKGRRKRVIDAVGKAMENILNDADRGTLPKSGWIRWRNRVQWQASEMRQRGFIRNDSPRGLWEISDEGRRWLDDN